MARRFGGNDAETGTALTMVQARLADPAVDLLGQVLATRVGSDLEFAQPLRQLADEANKAGDVCLAHGGAHLHGGVHSHAWVNQADRDQILLYRDDQP